MAEQDVINALEALEADIETLDTNIVSLNAAIVANTEAVLDNTGSTDQLIEQIASLIIALDG